jgi:hypothetical protein
LPILNDYFESRNRRNDEEDDSGSKGSGCRSQISDFIDFTYFLKHFERDAFLFSTGFGPISQHGFFYPCILQIWMFQSHLINKCQSFFCYIPGFGILPPHIDGIGKIGVIAGKSFDSQPAIILYFC